MANTARLVIIEADHYLKRERSDQLRANFARNLLALMEDVEIAATGVFGGITLGTGVLGGGGGAAPDEEARLAWDALAEPLRHARQTAHVIESIPGSVETLGSAWSEASFLASYLTELDASSSNRALANVLVEATVLGDIGGVSDVVRESEWTNTSGLLASFVYGFAALAQGPTTKATRTLTITPEEAARTIAAFEAPFEGLQRLADDGTLDVADEEFFRNTIQQVGLWRQRDEANPQIFELLIADLVKRLLSVLVDVDEMERALRRFGADDDTARYVAERVVASIHAMTELGGSDGVRDAQLLQTIADNTNGIEDAIRGLAPPPKKGLARKTGEAAVIAGGAATGKTVADAGLHAVVHGFEDHWSGIRIGLMMAWRTLKDLFVA